MSEKEYRHYCYKDGYTQALSDAVEAVEELIVNDPDGDTIDHNMAINEAIAAIKALIEGK